MSEEGYELKVTDRMHRIHRFIDIASGKAEYRRNLTSASAVQSIPHSSLEYMVSVCKKIVKHMITIDYVISLLL
ncbi:hypothetical protein TNCT_194331 [Trichonephila clavata]|uniref:Uncharacterized protein n=1 Tax=Trichonephila clavata TaxID=2740835 RepID=A0A8X6J4Q6_TRICU|nr:hypothetical protein TNCT_194331 [Trichonephila clavata]